MEEDKITVATVVKQRFEDLNPEVNVHPALLCKGNALVTVRTTESNNTQLKAMLFDCSRAQEDPTAGDVVPMDLSMLGKGKKRKDKGKTSESNKDEKGRNTKTTKAKAKPMPKRLNTLLHITLGLVTREKRLRQEWERHRILGDADQATCEHHD